MSYSLRTGFTAVVAYAGCAMVIVLLAAAPANAAAGDVARSQLYLQEAASAYRAHRFDDFLRALETAQQLNPGSYYTRYNLACAYALTGDSDKALDLLEQLVHARVDFGMADDDDLQSLRKLPRFKAAVAALAATTVPLDNSQPFRAFDEFGLMPEGIAYDAATGRLFFGSMRTGEIFAVDADGRLSRFAAVAHNGRLSAIGMTVDAGRGLLWVVGTRLDVVLDYDPELPADTGLFGFELGSGALQRTLLRHDIEIGFNDVTLGPGGDLYLSGGALAVVADGSDRIERLSLDTEIYGSNGIVATPDGRYLLTSSYPVGIARIRLADGAVRFLEAPPDIPLYGIDGMYLQDGDLIAVQNGVRPWRLMRLEPDDELNAIRTASAIDFGNTSSTATTGVIVGRRIYHVGEGPSPAGLPVQFPETMRTSSGQTVIMTAPLD